MRYLGRVDSGDMLVCTQAGAKLHIDDKVFSSVAGMRAVVLAVEGDTVSLLINGKIYIFPIVNIILFFFKFARRDSEDQGLNLDPEPIFGGDFSIISIPIVKRVFPSLKVKDIISVQPMSLPSGLLFYQDYTYSSKKNSNGGIVNQCKPRPPNRSQRRARKPRSK